MAVLAGASEAAPLANLSEGLQSSTPVTEPISYYRRHCWRHYGHWHCRRRVARYYYYDDPYYYGGPYYYGYGPGISLHFGGHRHFRRHRW